MAVKVSGHRQLRNFKSDYVFICHADPEQLKFYDRLDFGLFGRSWAPHISWAVVFARGVKEYNWREYLPHSRSNFMETGDLFDVVASGSSNAIFFPPPTGGDSLKRNTHGVRTMVPFNQFKTDHSRVGSDGGCLLLEINLLNVDAYSGDVSTESSNFDGQMYWNLYLMN